MMDSRHQIFLSYARADLDKVRPVYETLSKEGFEVYWDQTHLKIGDKWQEKIPDAISDSQLFLACLSTYSVKHDGYSQKEIRRALEISERKPLGSAFILPLLLDECAATMPKKLRDECTYVRFFEADGPVKLTQGIKEQLPPTKNAIAPVSSSSDIVGGLNALLCGLNARMISQSSTFTIHGGKKYKTALNNERTEKWTRLAGPRTLDDINEGLAPEAQFLKYYVVPKACKEEIKSKLFKLGIHHGSLFPELDGQARYMSDLWRSRES